jgi:PAS domain S-box-containing protein
MKLIHKLILGFWTVVLLSSTTGYYAVQNSKELLRKTFIEQTESLASGILDGIEREIAGKIDIFQGYTHDLILQETALRSNQDFNDLDDLQVYINRKDREWTSSPADNITPFMQSLINNRLSIELREKIDFFKEHYGYEVFGEIFVTNKYGANIAQTGKTTDYRQDDEEWWQKAKRDGLSIKDVEYDSSADVYSIDIGLSIHDSKDNFIGVMKVVLNIEDVVNFIKEAEPTGAHRYHKTMQFNIVTKEGRLIYSTSDNYKFLEDVAYLLPEEHVSAKTDDPSVYTGELVVRGNGDSEKYISHAHSRGLKGIEGLEWILVVEQEAKELFAPVTELRNKILTVTFYIIIASMFIGFIISAYISRNFRKLNDAAFKIGRGDLDAEIDVESNDEIGQLAKTFQKMSEELKATTVKRDELTKEMAVRREIEQSLMESEQKYRSIVETSPDMIFIKERETGKILDINESVCRLTGYTKADIIGTVSGDRVVPEQKSIYMNELEKLKNTGSYSGEFDLRKKDDTIMPVEVRGTAFGDYLVAIGRDVSERKHAEETIQLQLKRFNVLRFIDMTITASLDLDVTLNILTIQITTQLGIDAVAILLRNEQTETLEYAAGKGFRNGHLKHAKLNMGSSYAGRAAKEESIINVPDLRKDPDGFMDTEFLDDEGFISYLAIPLIAKGQVKGVMELFYRKPHNAEQDWIEFLENVADQAALAIENASLFNDLQHSNAELFRAYDTTIEGWSRAMDLKDEETEGHSRRVTEMTLRIAREFRISEEELVQIKWGALLHDIGKMGIPDDILLKPGPLTDEEWKIMKQHPVHALDMLYPIDYLRPSIDIPYCHHEKWDGTGYPRGLKGKDIPLAARIFSVVDVWDALRSDRPYRPAWKKEKVIEYICSLSNIQFDPEVVEAFLRIYSIDSDIHHHPDEDHNGIAVPAESNDEPDSGDTELGQR